ncbi:killer cell lectin-like receptor subfamily B member 1 [Ornithorhynchus anatinus]|uniref:C-type lectin domain-containing protein n=1 Tax=Ornithorhynchus anatinus TaxID=9258 RepID=A0A6I8PN91_ORNAN|nr:killer cell lectin-like receptor subfamily B member 1 [Ornithorhynchus anatinus]XP_028938054.1 killer cell lectin-like receptor subfamily B member 1 [Ornithorhynchus anatinus]
MDRNGLVYADLNLLEEPSPSRPPPPCQPQGFFKDSSAHLTVLKLLASGIIILTAAVIGLSIWVIYLRSFSSSKIQGSCNYLNIPNTTNSSSADPEPQNCPPQWKFHQGKCYLFSRGEKNWNESKADCTKKESSMLVIQDVRDLEFVQNTIFEGALFWIGLRAASLETAWTWVDHSPYNQLLFKITGNRNGEVCVQLSKKMAYSENCESEINWICQKNVSS